MWQNVKLSEQIRWHVAGTLSNQQSTRVAASEPERLGAMPVSPYPAVNILPLGHRLSTQCTTDKLRTAQREMERKLLGLKLQDKIPCSEIRKRTKINDFIKYILKQTWRWGGGGGGGGGHIARMVDQSLHSGNQREERDQEDDHEEDGKTT